MFKKLITLACCLSLAACGRPLDYNGKTYPTYGFLNAGTSKSNDMCYETSIGNVVWTVILSESIIFPIYFVGFSIFNPIGPKDANGNCGIDAR